MMKAIKETAVKNNLKLVLLLTVVSLFCLWIFRDELSVMWTWFSDMDAIVASIHNSGAWAPVTLFMLFILQVFLAFIPGQALMVACGYVYGFWGGFLISWVSLVVGSELAFLLVRIYGRSFAERWVSPEVLARWDKSAQGQGVGFFSIMLVMPLVPNDAMCYVAGLGTISHKKFFVATLLGRGMACVLTSAAGALGGSLTWQGWAIILILFALVGIIWQIVQRRFSKLPVL
jgi:uncharacterized membrane protein YdjX (TVP38/TMEM64 family)